jgi:hypothetical protein
MLTPRFLLPRLVPHQFLIVLLVGFSAAWLPSCDRNEFSDGTNFSRRADDVDDEDDGGGGGPMECPPAPAAPEPLVKINEIMVENTATVEDEQGNFPPWIELYNTTDAEIHLGNVPLSDDLTQPQKWMIPCVEEAMIPPRGFIVVFLDGAADTLGGLHANFSVLPGGLAQLVLNGGADLFFANTDLLAPDVSSGRFPDGAPRVQVLGSPTPGAANDAPGGGPPPPPPPPPPPLEAEFIRGDADENGRVSVADMSHVLQVLFGTEPMPSCRDRLDANDDGVINLSDGPFIGNALFGRGPTLPPPYPGLGRDPTADGLPCPLP